ncbi:MAG TPA: hypothetical protein VK444_06970 [Methanobacteriaceae archaeon]|nr:hypothetical protein [Methanobacteriaceae archaeon]
MDRKGQASAEYLLLVVVILIVLGWLIINVYQPAIGATVDISGASETKNAVGSIADAVNLVYANGPGAKRTLNLYIPPPAAITANNTTRLLGMNVLLSNGTSKYVNDSVNYNVTIVPPTVTTKKWYTVTVEWNLATRNYITVTIA